MEPDLVYHGRIRPAMYAGVSQSWLVCELLLCFVLFIGGQSFVPLLCIPVLHAIGAFIALYDKQALEVEAARSRCHSPLRRIFGHNVYSP
jgi:type IV secretory pathway VirB3-like protein